MSDAHARSILEASDLQARSEILENWAGTMQVRYLMGLGSSMEMNGCSGKLVR